MTINELIAQLQALAATMVRDASHPGTLVVVNCLEASFHVDCVQIEREGEIDVVAIRIEPDGERR